MAWLLLATVFLPLFPLSMVLNATLGRFSHPLARCMLLLLWPQIGVLAIHLAGTTIPSAFLPWALLSAGLYALRLLTVSDLGVYAGFLASSSLALTWGLAISGADVAGLSFFAFCFSFPAALLTLLVGPLSKRFGAAYAGVCSGLGSALPRLSSVLVLTILAGIATAPFPTFFAQLTLLSKMNWSGALAVLAIWLIWGFGAARLLRGFVFGKPSATSAVDIGRSAVWALAILFGIFTLASLYLAGGAA